MKATMVQAINQAIFREMERDSSVLLMGEDIGRNGGVFRVTEGLLEKFGEDRVIDTPIAEATIVGSAIGMALNGLRPVVELQFDGFMLPAFEQIIAHLSRIRNRSRGRFSLPIVIRAPYGGGVRTLEHHSESPESYFIHTPGIKVVIPSSPRDAMGLFASAVRDPDPVIFLEPKKVYRAMKEELPDGDYTVALGESRVISEGEDVTVIAWGAMIKTVMDAVDGLGGDIYPEIVDLRTLSPLDDTVMIESVRKTGRALIVHEAPKTLGFGAECVALINEKAFFHMKAPVKRLTGPDTVIPLAKLEHLYIPNEEMIAREVMKLLEF